MKRILSLFFCLLVSTAFPVWADSVPFLSRGLAGTDIVPIRNDSIRMVGEIVDIDCKWTDYTVCADFVLKNTTELEQKVQMGFPVDYVSTEEGQEGSPKEFRSFRVIWNGQPIKYRWVTVKPASSADSDVRRKWACWTVRFAPGEEARHQVSYTFPTWNMDGGGHGDEPFAYLKYVLKSGAAWQGSIGYAIIRIHYGHPLHQPDEYFAEPETLSLRSYPGGCGFDSEKRIATWKFKNFEPDRDIYFGWRRVPDFEALDKKQPMVFEDVETKPKVEVKPKAPRSR